MANEVQYRASLRILKRDSGDNTKLLVNKNHNAAFNDDMNGNKGPSPGAVLVPIGGVAADLSQLTRPGWCVFTHEGRANGSASVAGDHVEVGVRDTSTGVFYPFGELRPGMHDVPFPLSRNILEEYTNTGTGTTGPGNQLFLKAWPVSQNVSVECYEA